MFRPVVAIIRFLSFDSLKIILYNLRGSMFDEEISTSKPLLGVWLTHTPNTEILCSNRGFDVEISNQTWHHVNCIE